MKLLSRTIVASAAAALAAVSLAAPSQAKPTPTPPSTTKAAVADSAVDALRAAVRAGTAATVTSSYAFCAAHGLACQAQVLAAKGTTKPLSSTRPIGLGAGDLAAAYNVAGTPSGHGTIAVIDAAAYPKAGADLAVYRAQYHLPACTQASGCLQVMSYTGGPELPPATTRLGRQIEEYIALETALDLQMASAACPSCKLMLVQVPGLDGIANNAAKAHRAETHFARGVRTAKAHGANAVSISYGYPADATSNTGTPATLIDVTGVAVTASTGDSGFNGLQQYWPSTLRSVIAVGGTSLVRNQTTHQWQESAWNAAGSGCAPDLAPAFGQPASVAANCRGHRAASDISADADPYTGVAVYDSYAPFSGQPYNWVDVGGTSASSPYVAGLYTRSGVSSSVHGPNQIYAAPASAFRDIVAGANSPRGVCSSVGVAERVCTADVGWDGPSGLGSPVGLSPFH